MKNEDLLDVFGGNFLAPLEHPLSDKEHTAQKDSVPNCDC